MHVIEGQRDEDILEMAQSGRTEDFRRAATTAFRRYFRDLHAHVRARLPEDDAAVQDVLQEVALAIVEGLHRVRAGVAIKPWLLQIASNKVCDHLRRTQRTRARFDAQLGATALEHIEDPEGGIERLLERAGEAQLAAYLRRTVDSLNPHQREAVTLVYFEGVPPAEAAARLGLRADALAALLYRARKAFIQMLEAERRGGGTPRAADGEDAERRREHAARNPSARSRPAAERITGALPSAPLSAWVRK